VTAGRGARRFGRRSAGRAQRGGRSHE